MIRGNLVDVFTEEIYPAEITFLSMLFSKII
jgi:hypothetical protein